MSGFMKSMSKLSLPVLTFDLTFKLVLSSTLNGDHKVCQVRQMTGDHWLV